MMDEQSTLDEHYRIERRGHVHGQQSFNIETWSQREELGSGSFGVVYLDVSSFGRLRAIKEVRKRRDVDFKSELMTLTRLAKTHYEQYFGRFLGWYEDEKYLTLAMEYFPLRDLAKHLADGEGLSEKHGRDITWQLLAGLNIMHQNGIAHRDLKPSNIFVVQKEPRWRIKIGDFGVSKRLQHTDSIFQTRTGTVDYMAPELLYLLDENAVSSQYTFAVDIWSVGIIAYELMAGCRPFKDVPDLRLYCKTLRTGKQEFQRGAKISHMSSELISRLLAPRSGDRLTAVEALADPWFVVSEPEDILELPNIAHMNMSNSPAIAPSQPETETVYASPAPNLHELSRKILSHVTADARKKLLNKYHEQGAITSDLVKNFQQVIIEADPSLEQYHEQELITIARDGLRELIRNASQTQQPGSLTAVLKQNHNAETETTKALHHVQKIPKASEVTMKSDRDASPKAAQRFVRRQYFASPGRTDSSLSLALSQDGLILAGALDNGDIQLWPTQDLKNTILPEDSSLHLLPLRKKSTASRVYCLCFSPDGRLLAALYKPATTSFLNAALDREQYSLVLWSVVTGYIHHNLEHAASSRYAKTMEILFSADGRKLIFISNTIFLTWDVFNGKRLTSIEFKDPFSDVDSDSLAWEVMKLSPDGQLLALCENHSVTIRDCITWDILHTLHFTNVSFRSQQTLLAWNAGTDSIVLYDLEQKIQRPVFRDERLRGKQVAISPHAQLVIAVDPTGSIFWNTETGTIARRFTAQDMEHETDMSVDGQTVVSSCDDGSIKLLIGFHGGLELTSA